MKNKLLIKTLGLLGYKLVNKNTFKNNRLISHKSFLTIERALNTIFENKKIDFSVGNFCTMDEKGKINNRV